MNKSAFAALGQTKSGFWQGVADKTWNSTIKPIGAAMQRTVNGAGEAAAGIGNAAYNTVAAVPRAAGSAATAAVGAAGKSLGQSAQNIGYDATRAATGAGNAAMGAGETIARTSSLPITVPGNAIANTVTSGLNALGAPPRPPQPAVNPGGKPGMPGAIAAGPPAPPPAAPPAPPARPAAPAAPQVPMRPTPAQIAQYERGTRSRYRTNSDLDQEGMKRLMAGDKNWADQPTNRAAMNATRAQRAMLAKAGHITLFEALGPVSLEKFAGKMKVVGNLVEDVVSAVGKGGKKIAPVVAKGKGGAPIESVIPKGKGGAPIEPVVAKGSRKSSMTPGAKPPVQGTGVIATSGAQGALPGAPQTTGVNALSGSQGAMPGAPKTTNEMPISGGQGTKPRPKGKKPAPGQLTPAADAAVPAAVTTPVQDTLKALEYKGGLGGVGAPVNPVQDALRAAEYSGGLGGVAGGTAEAASRMSPEMIRALKIGGGVTAGAGALGVSHHMGYGSGREQGVGEGFDVGAEEGLQRARANMNPGGFFGMGQGGINMGSAYGGLAQDRQALLNNILRGAIS